MNGAGCSPSRFLGPYAALRPPNRAKSAAGARISSAFSASLRSSPCGRRQRRTQPAPRHCYWAQKAAKSRRRPRAAAATRKSCSVEDPAQTSGHAMATAWPLRERPAEFFELRAQNRQQTSDYVSSGSFALDTIDNDDHAFHGIVFDVELTGSVPIESLTIRGVSVRGALGTTKVLTSDQGFAPLPEERDRLEMRKYFSPLKPPREWRVRYSGEAPPATSEPRDLTFTEPVRMAPTSTKQHAALMKLGIYVHSEDAEGVVYNNQRHRGVTREDAHLKVLCGVAHTGGAPFARVGYWGDVAWRPRREFVGKVSYDVRLLLWTPHAHAQFPVAFRAMAVELAKCRAAKMLRPCTEIGLGHLPVEALYYVRNQCCTQSPRSLDRSCYANGSRDDPTQRHRGRET